MAGTLTLRIVTPEGEFPHSPIENILDVILWGGLGEMQVKPGHKTMLTTVRRSIKFLLAATEAQDDSEEEDADSLFDDSNPPPKAPDASPRADGKRKPLPLPEINEESLLPDEQNRELAEYRTLYIPKGFAFLKDDVLTLLVDQAGFTETAIATTQSEPLAEKWL